MLIRKFYPALGALILSIGNIAIAQDAKHNTAPATTLPHVSSERLGTGVPSRLPKAEVQRPVFTIQSGGPVALPKPQYRPNLPVTPPTTVATEAKNSLPIIEQTRPWQKSVNDNITFSERSLPTLPQNRQATAGTAPPGGRPATMSPNWQPPQHTAELPTSERRVSATTTPLPQRPQSRPTTTPAPTNQAPARVLNFSIN